MNIKQHDLEDCTLAKNPFPLCRLPPAPTLRFVETLDHGYYELFQLGAGIFPATISRFMMLRSR